MKKRISETIYWLIGGIIGVILGIFFDLLFIRTLASPPPSMYKAIFYICMTILVTFTLLGGVIGMINCKIKLLLKQL